MDIEAKGHEKTTNSGDEIHETQSRIQRIGPQKK
jgi:hypothetical protein